MSGLSSRGLQRVHDVMAGYVERGEVPGLVTLIKRRAEVHVDAIGTLERDGGGPLEDTVPALRPITLRDLLTFRLGFGAIFGSSPPIELAAREAGVATGPPMPAGYQRRVDLTPAIRAAQMGLMLPADSSHRDARNAELRALRARLN